MRARPRRGKALDAPAAAVAAPAPAAPAAPVDASGYRTAFDFIANRVHAVSHRDGRLVVDAGGLDFLKYVDGGWKTSWLLGEKDEGKPASLINGVSAMAFLPVDADGDGAGGGAPGGSTLSLTMRALAPAQKLSIFINEKPVGTLDVAGPKKRYDVAVPAGLLHPGDNRLRLTFKSAANTAGGKALGGRPSIRSRSVRRRSVPRRPISRSPRHAMSPSVVWLAAPSSRVATADAFPTTSSFRRALIWRLASAPSKRAAPR